MTFKYKIDIPVNYSSDGAQTNYQMKLTVYSGNGSSSAGSIYLNSHSLNWPYDIIFKNSNGEEIDYWRESYDASSQVVWVECDTIAASGTTSFSLYYGDITASDSSDGERTFSFFDDFNGTSIDTTLWANTNPTYDTVSSSILTKKGDGASWYKIYGNYAASATRCCRAKALLPASTTALGFEGTVCCSNRNIIYSTGLLSSSSSASSSTTGAWSYNTWYTFEFRNINATSAILWINDSTTTSLGATYASQTGQTPNLACLNTTGLQVDWYLVRNYTPNEPTWASPGVEVDILSGGRLKVYEDGVWRYVVDSPISPYAMNIFINGGDYIITTGTVATVTVPFTGNISAWTIVADKIGSMVIDIKKSTYINFPNTVSITGSSTPTLSDMQKNKNGSLSDWTTSITEGDILEFNVVSSSIIEKATINLVINRV